MLSATCGRVVKSLRRDTCRNLTVQIRPVGGGPAHSRDRFPGVSNPVDRSGGGTDLACRKVVNAADIAAATARPSHLDLLTGQAY